MEKIGGGEPEAGASRVVLGPGTGLGVAGLIRACGRWIPVPGEGGHMDIGPRTPRDFEVFPHLETHRGPHFGRADPVRPRPRQHLSRRRQGRRQSSRASPRRPRSPARRWPTPTRSPRKRWRCSSPASARTAGDLALVFKSRGGVFLTGGIAQKIVPALKRRQFPRRLRGQGAAQRADARRCRSMSSPIRWPRWPGLPPMRASPTLSASRPGGGAGRRNSGCAAESVHY